LLLLAAPGFLPQSNGSKAEVVEPISCCDLFRHSDRYPLGKPVRVVATWTYGFEWTYLSSRDCLDQLEAWVEFVDDDKLCSDSKANLKKMTHWFDNKGCRDRCG